MATPMFIVTGFLDSGKTTMIKDTLMEQEWIEPGLTLLLLCEEGEEEYEESFLKKHHIQSELIVVNRCADGVNRSGFRRALKVQNPMAQLIFEDMQGKIIEPSEEDLPYDVKGDKIVLDDVDFGVWYVDAYDHPELYLHKEIDFKGQIFRPKGMPDNMFVPVREIMTCCAEDVRYYGYPCKAEKKIDVKAKSWMQIRARFEYEAVSSFGNKQPVLYLIDMEPAAEPEDKVVYLG